MSDAVRSSLREAGCKPNTCTRNASHSERTVRSHENLRDTHQCFLSVEPIVVIAGEHRRRTKHRPRTETTMSGPTPRDIDDATPWTVRASAADPIRRK